MKLPQFRPLCLPGPMSTGGTPPGPRHVRPSLRCRMRWLGGSLCLLCGFLSLGESAVGAVIYDSWNADSVNNNPTILPVFTVSTQSKITEISNYHWNGGGGLDPTTVGATISIYDNTTNVLIGSWAAAAQYSNLMTYWAVYPDAVVQPGNYRVVESNPATWSSGVSDYFGYLGYTGPNWAVGTGFSRVSATAVPEPSQLILLGALGVLATVRRKRTRD